MNWYYAEGGQQQGPIDESQFQQLVQAGTIKAETLVWREGMASWAPYSQVVPPTAPQPGDDEAVCLECGKVYPKTFMIPYGGNHVCANCKPVFLQKISEGVGVSSRRGRRALPVDPDALVNEVLSRDYTLDIGDCIRRAYNLLKSNLWLMVGVTLLVLICQQAAGIIPIAGVFLSLILQGPLMGGLYIFYLKLVRGESATVGDAFSGFGPHFWKLCGTMLLMVLLIYAALIPAVIAFIPAIRNNTEPTLIAWVLTGLGVVVLMYLAVAFSFALPLAADLELGPWQALRTSFRVVNRHWFLVFGLMIVAGFVSAIGLILCIVGVLLTLPIFYAATIYAYEDIFGPK